MTLYLFKSFLLSGLLIGIYYLVLRNSGSFKFNRFYLLASLLILLLWPTVSFQFASEKIPFFLQESSKVIQTVSENPSVYEPMEIHNQTTVPIGKIFFGIYSMVTILLLIRFTVQLFRLLQVKAIQAREGYTIFPAEGEISYSFFNRLYLPKNKVVAEKVIQHERVHIRQWHSLDVCFLEMVLCFYWFNPFLWIFRSAIKENHEFLADQGAIQNDSDTEYLKLILQSVGKQNHHYLSNPFSFTSLKKRIKMIQQCPQSNRKKSIQLTLSLFSLLFILAAFSFKAQEIDRELNQQAKEKLSLELLRAPNGLPIEKSKIYKVASEFGKRIHPLTKKEKLHTGIDFLAAKGTPIIATAAGMVKSSKVNSNGYGKHVIIQHNASFSSLYAHMSSLSVEAGELVNKGDTLGIIGTSGTSLSIHLHYEIRENDKAVNPLKFIQL